MQCTVVYFHLFIRGFELLCLVLLMIVLTHTQRKKKKKTRSAESSKKQEIKLTYNQNNALPFVDWSSLWPPFFFFYMGI